MQRFLRDYYFKIMPCLTVKDRRYLYPITPPFLTVATLQAFRESVADGIVFDTVFSGGTAAFVAWMIISRDCC